MLYKLYYWPGIQGRGEYVRLALEEAGARYLDLALVPEQQGGGETAIEQLLTGTRIAHPPFAVPCLAAGRQLIGQTANILLFLGSRSWAGTSRCQRQGVGAPVAAHDQ
jgi:glutathione S-transferase